MTSTPGAILVVDDNENNRDLLARRLTRQGHRVTTAKTGRQALELLNRDKFDLIVLDIMMPEMNGYEVLEQLKAHPGLRHIPVIMISAIDDLDSIARCIELGAEDYLFKPFNPILLRARVGASLEKKRLRDQERAYLLSLQQEMELGRRTQSDFLPASLPQLPGWELAAAFHPAREVAGDFYDAFSLPNNRLGLVIADVCDKGVGAALFMALIRTLIRAFAEQSAPTAHAALNAVVLTSNYIVRHHHHNNKHMFATLFFGVLEPDTGVLTYMNGGHEPPIVLGAGRIKQMLDPTGPAVGMMADVTFTIQSVQLEPGDVLLAYTDGVTEARNRAGAFFSEERLLALLSGPVRSAATLLEYIESHVYEYVSNTTFYDDVTMLALHRLR